MIPIFPCDSQRSKGVPSGLLIGELGTPKLAQIFAYGKWLYPYRMLLIHGASDLDQRCLKTLICKDGCTFPPNIFVPTPKSPQNPILGTLQCKSIIERALRKSHVNGATKVKLYSYIGIGKYLGCVNIFPLGDVRERRAHM